MDSNFVEEYFYIAHTDAVIIAVINKSTCKQNFLHFLVIQVFNCYSTNNWIKNQIDQFQFQNLLEIK